MTYEPQGGPPGGKHRRPCGFCRVYPADLRDRETGLVWCLGCAENLIHTGDPITDYEEFDEGERYGVLLARHSSGLYTVFRRRGGPGHG